LSTMKRRSRLAPEPLLPPIDETLAVLDQLATHQYETKARTRAALKLAHRTLHDLLSRIRSSAKHPELLSSVTAESLHRDLRRSMQLDKLKRFPLLPRPCTPSEATAVAATPPAAAMSPERVAALFGGEGVEFDPDVQQ
jgi:hypothetical protein